MVTCSGQEPIKSLSKRSMNRISSVRIVSFDAESNSVHIPWSVDHYSDRSPASRPSCTHHVQYARLILVPGFLLVCSCMTVVVFFLLNCALDHGVIVFLFAYNCLRTFAWCLVCLEQLFSPVHPYLVPGQKTICKISARNNADV